MSSLAPEISVLVLALGLVFALFCYLVTNLSPGGMITPGWLALVLIDNVELALVMLVVVIVAYIATLGLQRVVILYGKRLFATVVLLAVFLQVTFFLVARTIEPAEFGYTTLGFIVPGLIAYQLVRQPIAATLLSAGAITMATYVIVLVGVELDLIETRGAGVSVEGVLPPALDVSLEHLLLLVGTTITLFGGLVLQMGRTRRTPPQGGLPL